MVVGSTTYETARIANRPVLIVRGKEGLIPIFAITLYRGPISTLLPSGRFLRPFGWTEERLVEKAVSERGVFGRINELLGR